MKSKKSIYVLLPLVLFIWGLLIYQFFSYSSAESNFSEIQPSIDFKPSELTKVDTFSFDVNYRDPFLGKMYKDFKKEKSVELKKTNSKPVVNFVWPDIKYKGIVSDMKDTKRVFLITINGKNFLMKAGETQNEVTLKKGDKNRVTLSYKNFSDNFLINE
jgi:hypothetical protein